ncbi:porin [Wenzhouxiangella sp. AB-CW3]|uniref:porin n=1 Tax=Wenzhouxiangella sp. AB-CW3 TaxID=2771012 RepID=UPI00168A4B0D|nr:porin [Wenzhouxiangella sp. AB-CW3]QOC23930.1 porin [Wenzhouxiangella sp. AB-CW3]
MTPRYSLIAAGFMLALLALPPIAAASDSPESSFSLLLRLETELVHVDGSAAEARDADGWHLTDGWAGGNKNAANFGALFIDGEHQVSHGLRAIGRFGFNINSEGLADGNAQHREIYLGLAGDFGQVIAGRLETPYKLSALGWDPLNATALQARGNFGRSGGAFGHASYIDSAIEYSNRFGPVSLRVMGALDERSETTSDHPMWSASLAVPAGPVEFTLAHIEASEFDDGPDERTGTKLGARYSEGPWTLAATYEIRDEGLEDGDFLYLSTSYRWRDWSFMASHGRFSDDNTGNNDARYSALAARFHLAGNVTIHGGLRRLNRDVEGSENIAGIGIRAIFNTGNLLSRN